MIDFDQFRDTMVEACTKGQQRKFYDTKAKTWYKIDTRGCNQGLAEEFVSFISAEIKNIKIINYTAVSGILNEELVNGCCSHNMYGEDVQFITLKQILKAGGYNESILTKYSKIEDNIRAVVQAVFYVTGTNILNYLRDNIFLDALILNEDRHYKNMGLFFVDNKYHIAPIFDNGNSLFCVNSVYDRDSSLARNIDILSHMQVRPFDASYDEQVEALFRLKVEPLSIDYNRMKHLIHSYQNINYPKEQVRLVKDVMLNRLEYYKGYLYV